MSQMCIFSPWLGFRCWEEDETVGSRLGYNTNILRVWHIYGGYENHRLPHVPGCKDQEKSGKIKEKDGVGGLAINILNKSFKFAKKKN